MMLEEYSIDANIAIQFVNFKSDESGLFDTAYIHVRFGSYSSFQTDILHSLDLGINSDLFINRLIKASSYFNDVCILYSVYNTMI